jgi:hypothetical protein
MRSLQTRQSVISDRTLILSFCKLALINIVSKPTDLLAQFPEDDEPLCSATPLKINMRREF